jgi:hypothetical protein
VVGISALVHLFLLSPQRGVEPVFPRDTASPMDEFVTVATYDKVIDAHIALGRLSAEGIEAQLFDEHAIQMDWLYFSALGGIKLRVPRGDEKAAHQVLATDYSASLNDVDVGKPEN